MLTHSHLCPSSLACSLTLIHFHTLYLSLPPASMRSLKLCLITSRHSQRHSALSARLPHTCTHTRTHIPHIPQCCWILSDKKPGITSPVDPLVNIMRHKMFVSDFLVSWADRSLWSCCRQTMNSSTAEQGHLCNSAGYTCLLFMSGIIDRKKKGHQNRSSKATVGSQGQVISVFCRRRLLYCAGHS